MKQRESRVFRTKANVYNVNAEKFLEIGSPLEFISQLFQHLVDDIKRHAEAQEDDKIRLGIYHPALKLGVFGPFTDVSALTGESITDELEKVLQSNEDFKIDDGQLSMEVTHTRLPTGSGRKVLHNGLYFDSTNMMETKLSMVRINNSNDSICMDRAIVVGKWNADKEDSETWRKTWLYIRKSDRPFQTREAIKLLERAQVSKNKPCRINKYKKFQAVLAPNYLIKVHSPHPKDGLIFKPQFQMTRDTKVTHIYYNGDHYDTLTSVTGFRGCIYYCEYCDQGYNNRGSHYCSYECDCC